MLNFCFICLLTADSIAKIIEEVLKTADNPTVKANIGSCYLVQSEGI